MKRTLYVILTKLISYLIESLEQSIRNPKNSDALQHVPIQLVERFKEDIESFKIRYQNLIEEKLLSINLGNY